MFKKIILLLIVSNLFLYKTAISQEPPYLKDVKVIGNVSLKNGVYTFTYSITNGIASSGDLYSIDIDIALQEGSASLSSDGLTIPRGKQLRTFEQETPTPPAPLKRITTIPVGMERPEGWMAGIGIDGSAGWGSRDKFAIKSGKTLGGFKLISYGLPSVRNFKVQPWLDATASYYPGWESVEGAEDESAAIVAKVKELIQKVTFKGKTVGPTAPLADFKPALFLDYIIDLKHQAVSLGWITNDGIVNSLDVKLDNAKKKIAEGSPGAAKNILNAFINEVEAQGCATYENCPPGKHLTSEAYALLKYNAQYLIDNLSK